MPGPNRVEKYRIKLAKNKFLYLVIYSCKKIQPVPNWLARNHVQKYRIKLAKKKKSYTQLYSCRKISNEVGQKKILYRVIFV